MEGGETDFEAALRETEEESGLILDKDYVCPDKFKVIESTYPVKSGEKRVAYFLGRSLPGVIVKLSDESVDFRWLTLNALKEFLVFRRAAIYPIFEKAEEFLSRSS